MRALQQPSNVKRDDVEVAVLTAVRIEWRWARIASTTTCVRRSRCARLNCRWTNPSLWKRFSMRSLSLLLLVWNLYLQTAVPHFKELNKLIITCMYLLCTCVSVWVCECVWVCLWTCVCVLKTKNDLFRSQNRWITFSRVRDLKTFSKIPPEASATISTVTM